MLTALLLFHICTATLGLLSGYMAMIFRKGSGLHSAAGNVFFVSMLGMSSSGAYIAMFLRPLMLNVEVALLTFYLVSTAWRAARRRDGKTDAFDIGAFLFVLGVGVAGWTWGMQGALSPSGLKDRIPAPIYFVFGTIALLCAVTDVRMLVRGSLVGPQRIARHLWRMCLALLIATFSLYPGQGKLFPEAIRATGLLFVPHLLLLGSMIFWRLRVRARKRVAQDPIRKDDSMKLAVAVRTLVVCLLAPAAVALAEENPLSAHNRMLYGEAQKIVLRSAEKTPEEHYGFRPVESVRSFGEVVGHIADAQYMFCSAVLGEKNPSPTKVEKNKTSKAELVAALQGAFAYCDKAYAAMSDKGGVETIKFFGGDTPKLSVLNVNNLHTIEHYGNLVTYMRMKNIVPPTSEPGFRDRPAK